jgi:hypothetical protein
MLVVIHAAFIPLFAADAAVNGKRDHRLANAKKCLSGTNKRQRGFVGCVITNR